MKNERTDTLTPDPAAPEPFAPARRDVLKGGLILAGGFVVGNALAQPEVPDPPTHNPDAEFVFSIFATIAGTLTVGETATGQIRAIPITGGEVVGESLNGRVVPGGADWQRTRADGVTELEATYAIEAADGTLIKVVNRGLLVPQGGTDGADYFRTVVSFTAPRGTHDWLNEAIFLCSAGLDPEREQTVQIDVYKLI
jgi:hypothetical protein